SSSSLYAYSLPRYSLILDLHSFPTRRSSDLEGDIEDLVRVRPDDAPPLVDEIGRDERAEQQALRADERPEGHLAVVEPHARVVRSEEHTSELQSRFDLVCRLLLEKKKQQDNI